MNSVTTLAPVTVTTTAIQPTTAIVATTVLEPTTITRVEATTVTQVAATTVTQVAQTTVTQVAPTTVTQLVPTTVTQVAATTLTQVAPTTVTQIVAVTVTAPAETTAVPGLVVDRAVQLSSPQTFELTGRVTPGSGVVQIEFYDHVNGRAHDLGAATLNKDGTFSFTDQVRGVQGFISAVATDGSGQQSTLDVSFALANDKTGPRQEFYNPTTGAYEGETIFYRNGSPKFEQTVAPDGSPRVTSHFGPDGFQRTDVEAGGQTVRSVGPSLIHNNGSPDTTFVFDAGHGASIIKEFRVDGTDHDTIDLPSADFQSMADVLHHTQSKGHDSVIHDPVTGDTVTLVGVSKDKLRLNPDDFKFHD